MFALIYAAASASCGPPIAPIMITALVSGSWLKSARAQYVTTAIRPRFALPCVPGWRDHSGTPDELPGAIHRVEGKRRELVAAQPQAKHRARVLAMLPKAAALYRQQIAEG